MPTILKRILAVSAGLTILAAAALKATPVTVHELGMGPNVVVNITSSMPGWSFSGGVYAGVVRLEVNGTPTNGFCIDPWHLSVGGTLPYDLRPLAQGPAWPGPMGSAAALEIEKLWGNYYT